jgi:V8-like Glu-specific endopeptidase
VYGDDDRREYYELVGADRDLLDATAVFIPQAALSSSAGEIRFRGPTLQELEGVCPDEPFADQLAIGQCSGFLIDERLLMTAGHCTDRMACPSEAIVFGFHNIAEGELGPVTAGDVYSCERVLVYEEHMGGESNLGDFAILELDRPVDRTPLELTQTGWPEIGDELVLLGYPDGIPGKLARNGRVVDFDTDLEFHLHVDSFHGNSGSALYDPVAGTVAAILTHGEDDYVYDDVAGCHRVAVLDESDETVREVGNWVYAPIIELCERGYPSERICGMAEECGDGFCSFGESCDADCDAEVPEDWGCSSAWYGDGEVCHCECGAVDPDCVEDSEVDGCRPGQGCGTDGLCGPGDIEWTCDPEFFGYGTGDGCDCACGAYDPDCDDGGPVINCGAGAICDPDGECVGGIAVPSEWDCNLAYYAAGDDCDCECGTYDPDCDDPGAEVLSCEAGETCSEIGQCVSAGAPVDVPLPT